LALLSLTANSCKILGGWKVKRGAQNVKEGKREEWCAR